MSQILALSFDGPASPSLTLRWNARSVQKADESYGWGMAWYPPDDRSAVVIKDPTAVSDDPLTRVLRDWSRFRSTVFLCHLRGAAARRSQDDTHPFVRIFGERSWLITHHGQLEPGFRQRLALLPDPVFEPVGHTDTEHVLCWLLGRARQMGARTIADIGYQTLHGWLVEANGLGTANFLMSDGIDLVAYQDMNGFHPLHWARFSPASGVTKLEDTEVEIDIGDPLDLLRSGAVIATQPLAPRGFSELSSGTMVVLRRSAFVWSSNVDIEEMNRSLMAPPKDPAKSTGPASAADPLPISTATVASGMVESAGHFEAPVQQSQSAMVPTLSSSYTSSGSVAQPSTVESSVLEVSHRTLYRYNNPVEMSRHVMRLRPTSNRHQQLLSHDLQITPHGTWREFDDVFGNQVLRLDIEAPFSEMVVESRCRVRVVTDARSMMFDGSRRRSTIPVPWMPWDRQMMNPYLLPGELPETQLRELFDYAMSFVERQDSDLLWTLDDMNRTIFREWAYVTGSTTLETTPFDVFSERRGVCQDFANLMITLARLIGVPARYRTGYIYTGQDAANPMQSDASHAWVELYLPLWGWTGFDPTNGCRANLDHVRVACGRNYRDAAPTSGTIYRGGGDETLDVEVRVIRVE